MVRMEAMVAIAQGDAIARLTIKPMSGSSSKKTFGWRSTSECYPLPLPPEI
jgi:hypothetical protein